MDEPDLTIAVADNDIQAVAKHLSEGGKLERLHPFGETLLMISAFHNHLEMTKLLLNNGADPNRTSPGHDAPLTVAAKQGHLALVEVLLEAGADPFMKNDLGQSALHWAWAREQTDVADLIKRRQDEVSEELVSAVRVGDVGAVRALLSQGRNPNAKNKEGWTPLGLAVTKGNLPIVQSLIIYGAGVNIKYSDGFSPLEGAVTCQRTDVVNLLLENGADPNTKARNGCPLLLLPAFMGHLGIVEALLKHNADATATDSSGHTALMVAASNGHKDVVAALQRARQVSIPPVKRSEDFFRAIRSGEAEAVERFLNEGVNPNARDSSGYPALTIAVTKGQNGVVEILVVAYSVLLW